MIWSGKDIEGKGFFDDIVQLIRKSDFCIFDDRLMEQKPNVFIEAGIAYAFQRPFIYASFQGNNFEIPSDLKHIQQIQYKNYPDLSKQIMFNLESFLTSVRLARRL